MAVKKVPPVPMPKRLGTGGGDKSMPSKTKFKGKEKKSGSTTQAGYGG